jgi:hypothetical protein
MRRDIRGHNGSGSHSGVVADADSWQQYRTGSDIAIVL